MINPKEVVYVCDNLDKKTCTIGIGYPGFDSKGRAVTLVRKEIVPLKEGATIAKMVAMARSDLDKAENEMAKKGLVIP